MKNKLTLLIVILMIIAGNQRFTLAAPVIMMCITGIRIIFMPAGRRLIIKDYFILMNR